MSDSETEKKEMSVDEFLDEVLNKIDNDPTSLRNRLVRFKTEVFSYQFHPQHFHIMADAYLTFFKMDDELVFEYLSGSINEKMEIVIKIDELEEPEKTMKRAMHMAEILLFNSSINPDSIYSTAGNLVLYTLTGSDNLLTSLGMSYYKLPKQRSQGVKSKLSDAGNEGMYH